MIETYSHKLNVAVHSNSSKMLTGFGGFARDLLLHLYNTKKYNVLEFANGTPHNDPLLNFRPWKAFSTYPSDDIFHQIDRIQDPNQKFAAQKSANYGTFSINNLIKSNKIDVVIHCEDYWGLDFRNQEYWDKINVIVHTTVDSRPIKQQVIDIAKSVKHFYPWAKFCIKDFQNHGITHVKDNIYGNGHKAYKPLSVSQKFALRKNLGLSNSDFVGLYVFRNQLRKLVPNLLDGYKIFCERNPKTKHKLILSTNWSENSWNIPELIQQRGINPKNILAVYYCDKCEQFFLKDFSGEGIDCVLCDAKGSAHTPNIHKGLSFEQMNELYNVSDYAISPITSGGLELHCVQALLTKTPLIANGYSCQEDYTDDGVAIPIEQEWNYERESGFRKASPKDTSIAEKMEFLLNWDDKQKEDFVNRAYEWAKNNFDIGEIGKKFESIIDSCEKVKNFEWQRKINLDFQPDLEIMDDIEYVESLYQGILGRNSDENGKQSWLRFLDTAK